MDVINKDMGGRSLLFVGAPRLSLATVATLAALVLTAAPALASKEYVLAASFGRHVDKTTGENVCTAASKDECGPGEEGTEPGEFKEPTGVAVNDSLVEATAGDVYVLDKSNDRVEWFNSAGSKFEGEFNGSGTPAAAFSEPEGIAVDNSGKTPLEDPAVGDVYVADVGNKVIDRFSATGKYEGQLTGTCKRPGEAPPCAGGELVSFGEPRGVAVDADGNLWVSEAGGSIDEFSGTGTFLKAFNTGKLEPGLAVDSSGNVYVSACCERYASKFSSTTGKEVARFEWPREPGGPNVSGGASALAINPSTGSVLIDNGETTKIELYGPFGEPYSTPLQRFGGGLSESHGVTVNGASAAFPIYASERGAGDIKVFEDLVFPTVSTEAASGVGETAVTFHGSVTPEGEEITGCEFEFGTSATEPGEYPNKASCSPSVPYSGAESVVDVSATITGLEPRSTYHYRLTAVNKNGTRSGKDTTVYTIANPIIEGEEVSKVGSAEATVSAQINAGGLATTYRVEYGTSNVYGSSSSDVSLGAPQGAVGVLGHLTGLQPRTVYHFELVANNAFGSAAGGDMTFTTVAGGSGGMLPDNRAYELVSGAGNPGEVYTPAAPELVLGNGKEEDILTEYPLQASADGDAVAYVGDPGEVGGIGLTGGGLGNEFLATRDLQQRRWDVSTVTPAPSGHERDFPGYEWFSSDLTFGVLGSSSQSLALTARPEGPAGEGPEGPAGKGEVGPCNVLYSRTASGSGGSDYHALFTETQSPGFCGKSGPPVRPTFSAQNLLFAGASGDGSQLLFQTPAALTTAGHEAPEGTGNNLYDSLAGKLNVVNVLPLGEQDPNAVFGGPSSQPESRPDFSNVIASDGLRIFWTDLTSGQVYVREHPTQPQSPIVAGHCITASDACTVPVSTGPAKYWTATADGHYVLYTEGGKLWRFDTFGDVREELASAGVQGVIGASDDGSYVYFVSEGALAPGAAPRTCEEAAGHEPGEPGYEEQHGHLPPGKGCNLYLLHAGTTTFITALAAQDDRLSRRRVNEQVALGAWQPELGSRTAEVTPSGRQLVFESTQQLTGYDNSRALEFETGASIKPEAAVEVFVYDSGSGPGGRLSCASCDPRGAPPLRGARTASFLPLSVSPTSMRRSISEDGSRVFFNTSQALVPQDTNGVQDVYEWEREGTPGCPVATSLYGGCVFLLSGGNSTDQSWLVDADLNGDNVFFTHRGQLGEAGAPDYKMDLFDARVGGGFPQTSLACTGAGCQGIPPALPPFATPSSATFSGLGNFLPPTSPGPAKPLSNKQKLANALKACRKKHNKHKRQVCEKTAHRKYPNKPTAKRAKRAKRASSKRGTSR